MFFFQKEKKNDSPETSTILEHGVEENTGKKDIGRTRRNLSKSECLKSLLKNKLEKKKKEMMNVIFNWITLLHFLNKL